MENDLRAQLETKDSMIKTLQDSIKLKEDQISMLKDSINMKDEQIKTIEDSLKTKIKTLEKELEIKEVQLNSSSSTEVNESILIEKDKEIEELKKEIEILNDELSKSDEELEQMELELSKLKENFSNNASTIDSKIIDYTHIQITKLEIIEKMREILEQALHNVMITVPDITDLQDLYLYEVRSSVNMKISCLIDPSLENHTELLEEFESLDNISIRMFDGKDRYVLNRDGEEMFFAVKGNEDNNHLVFHSKDSAHIKLFNSLIMESWLRGRKI
ncbi:MAG: hypothetical protein ACTSQJ_16175 [Promethearchaeota archaeon]